MTPQAERATIRRVALAINPTSGGGRGERTGEAVRRRLAGLGLEVIPLRAGSAAELTALARSAVAGGADALVVVGGDGMVHLGANVVSGTPTPLGVVPAGTGNDIARGLGLSIGDGDVALGELVAAIECGGVHPMDAARCDTAQGERWFAGVLAAGFDALVNERANGWRWPRGRRKYDLAILRELPIMKPRRYRLDLDGRPWDTPAVMVVVANGPSYGGGMQICPGASTNDGLLDVLVVLPLSRTAFVRIYPRVYAGTHLDDPRVIVRRARRVEVAAEGIVAYADGERLSALPLTCEAVPGALRVLLPPPTG